MFSLDRALRWSIVLTVAALPWYIVRFTVAGVPLTLVECLCLFTIGLWGVGEALRVYHQGLLPYSAALLTAARRHWLMLLPIGLFLLAATIAVATSEQLTAALGIYKAYIIEPLLLALVIVTSIKTRQEWYMVAGGLLLAALQVSVVAISQHLWGWPNFTPAELIQGRSSAMYNTANAVGLFVGPVVLLASALAISFWQKRRWLLIWFGIGAAAGIISIAVSQSEGAAVALLASGGLAGGIWWATKLGWLNYRTWLGLAVAGSLLYVLGVVAYVGFWNHPPEVANPYTRPGFSTFTVRQCTWQGTYQLLMEHPIAGSGLAGFADTYLAYATCDAEPLVYPHNFVLNFWAETGLLGLLSIIGVATAWLALAGKLLFSSKNFWIGLGLSLALIYWLIHGLVDVPYFKNDLSMEWWLLFSLTIVASWKLSRVD